MEKILYAALAGAALLVLAGCGIKKEDSLLNAVIGKVSRPKAIEQKERKDDWAGTVELSGIKGETLTVATEDAKPVRITFTNENEKREWESYTGGADADYEIAAIEGDAPEAFRKIIDDYNAWVSENLESELTEGRARWELYHASDPDGYIALTPHIGMGLCRSDTSVLSYVTAIHRYNRDYEPDDTFVHGHTYDAQSGRELSINDFVTDPEKLAVLVCKALKTENANYSDEISDRYLDAGFQKRVLESINGCRDDGRFAWAVNPAGFDFYFTDPFYQSEYLNHETEHAFVPFTACREFLFQDVTVSYDHILLTKREHLAELCGISGKLSHEKDNAYYTYLVQKDGETYLYLCEDEETQAYRVKDGRAEYVGSIRGVLADWNRDCYAKIIEPDHFVINTEAFLVREMNSLSAPARIGENGVPELLDLFREDYNVEPMSAEESFEAEVFENEEDEEPKVETIEAYTWMNFVRTDAETFIDMEMDDERICRLYVTGNYEDGFIVNGHPAEEILNLQGWLEE
ncbi:MAG: hypothetical protein J5518_08080 [Lachnospiraceae bacterium]|nr:hypothetical protein [Lachnospiraceae bacterium]